MSVIPDWFILTIIVLFAVFVIVKSAGAARSKRRKSRRVPTRDQKIRRLERELKALKRGRLLWAK